MYCSKRIYLMFLPLFILLCLTCPVKQEIKRSLNIPINIQLDLEKSNNFRSCISTFQQNDLTQKNKKQAEERYFLFTDKNHLDYRGNFTSTNLYPHQPVEVDILSVPLFIYHRKLII